MPLLLAGQTEGWKLYVQLTDGSFIRANPTDRIRLAGATSSQPVQTTNDSTHIYQSDETTHICSAIHGNNTKRLTSSTASINGAASSVLPVAIGSCPILLSFFSLDEVTTNNAKIYSYNGTADTVPIAGATIYLAEGGQSST